MTGGVNMLSDPFTWFKDNWLALIIFGALVVGLFVIVMYLWGYIKGTTTKSTMLVRSKKGYMPDPGIPARKLIEVTQNYRPRSNYTKLKGADQLMQSALR
jgi:hypothetical protein